MYSTARSSRSRPSGFTLIELMIVIAIIGVLASVGVPKFGQLLDAAKDANTKGNLGALRSAIGIYYGNTEGRYPTFPPNWSQPSGYNTFLRDAIVPEFIAEIPQATPSGNRHRSSNAVDHVWNDTSNEDNEPVRGYGWKYVANPFDPEWGKVKVLCTHNSAKGSNWSTF